MDAPAIRQAAHREKEDREAGMTLVELLISFTVMSVFLTIFTTGILAMYRSANTSEAISTARSQVAVAFLRLDKDLRYATEISDPGQVGGDWYVEYRQLTNVATCGELRLRTATGALQQRRWTEGTTPGLFTTLASSVSSTTQPFQLIEGDPTGLTAGAALYQQLKVTIDVSAGPAGGATVKHLGVTFTAANATRDTPGASTCSQAGRANP